MNRQQRRAAERQQQRVAGVAGAPDTAALFRTGVAYHQAGRLAEAAAAYRAVLAANPKHPDALHLAGLVELQAGRAAVAAELIGEAIRHNDRNAAYHCHHGNAHAQLGQLDQAVGSYDRAIALQPNYGDAYANRGDALAALGRNDAAVTSYDRATAIQPTYAEVWCNRGNPLRALGRHAEAVASYDRAIALQPDMAEAWSNRGTALLELGQHDAATASLDRAIAIRPGLAEAWYNRGSALAKIGQRPAALDNYQHALALRPNHAETWSNQGVVLFEMGRATEAVTCFDQALRRKPDHPEAWYNRGNALRTLGQFADATTSYERAMVLKPDYAEAQSELIHLRQLSCDWRSRAADDTALLDLVHRGHAVEPFVLLGTTASPTDQLRCARQWAARFQRPSVLSSSARQKAPGERITLGYLSGDFRHHPLAFLVVDLLAQHDRSRFEVIGYDIGPDDGSAIRGRVVAACDRFVELRELSDLSAAQAIARDGVDIVVDLSGYTSAARPGVLAYRPAPLQVSYLGYIGSMGADFVDYVIADAVALPSDQQEFYDERIVHLPVSYQANGTSRAITDRQFSRVECGLPVHGCVFCCFNTSYKITPKIFAIWMRLLAGVPDSVLWLVGADPLTESNLQREAAARGIAAERLVFAPKIGHAEHLARYRLADLFLDTLPYSAGATASDALWAGLPVLTQLGAGFAGRMAASVLTAVGLPELIANSAAEYEATALRLATHPAERQLLRTFLQERGRLSALFDAARCARHLEAAFATMWQRRSDGLPPAGFAIAEVAA